MSTKTRVQPLYEEFEDEFGDEQKISSGAVVALAVGAAALTAGAIYLLTGERGEQTRAKLRDWAERMRNIDIDRYGRMVGDALGRRDERDVHYDRIR